MTSITNEYDTFVRFMSNNQEYHHNEFNPLIEKAKHLKFLLYVNSLEVQSINQIYAVHESKLQDALKDFEYLYAIFRVEGTNCIIRGIRIDRQAPEHVVW